MVNPPVIVLMGVCCALGPERTRVSEERSEAIVLRGVDFSETSRIVTFLTPGRGKVACMAKGARRRNSPMAAVLDALNRVDLVYYWKDGRGVHPMGEASLLDGFRGIKEDLERTLYAAFPIELAYKVAHENEPSEALYAVLASGLTQLAAWRHDARGFACWHVLQLLSAAGFEPSVDACGVCGGDLTDNGGFSYGSGLTCASCQRDRRVTSEERQTLQLLMNERTACPVLPGVGYVYDMVCRFAARQVESDFRSVRVIEDMFR